MVASPYPAASALSLLPRGADFPLMSTESLRQAQYAEARAFAGGAQWLGRRRRGETRQTYNYAMALVRKVASYVYSGPLVFSVPAPSPGLAEAAHRAELLLAELVAELDLAELDVALCVDASISGDAAVKVTWDVAGKRPRVVAVDPAGLRVWWAPDDPTRALRVAHCYYLPGYALGSSFGLNQGALGGISPDQQYLVVEDWTDRTYKATIAGQYEIGGANPYGWIPYVVQSDNRPALGYWGQSDLADLYDVCREINTRMSVLGKILELSGAPIAVLENVEGSDDIAVGPGAKWELPEGAKAYLLDLLQGQGVQLHISNIAELMRTLYDLAEVPKTAFGGTGNSDMSGAALEVEIQPLVQRVQRKWRVRDRFNRRRNAMLLDLMERFGGADISGLRRTVTLWPSVLPSDREALIQGAVQLVSAGIRSRRSAASDLGEEDPDGEIARILEESAMFGGDREEDPDDEA